MKKETNLEGNCSGLEGICSDLWGDCTDLEGDCTEKIIKKRELFIISHGEYSDYSIKCMCTALQDIDIEKLETEFRKEVGLKEEDELFYDYYGFFVHWLTNIKKCAKEIEMCEFHVGNYCDFDFTLRKI